MATRIRQQALGQENDALFPAVGGGGAADVKGCGDGDVVVVVVATGRGVLVARSGGWTRRKWLLFLQ